MYVYIIVMNELQANAIINKVVSLNRFEVHVLRSCRAL